MYFVTRAATPIQPFAVAIMLLAVFSASLAAMPPGCASSSGGSLLADTKISSRDQAGRRWDLDTQKGRLFIITFLAVIPDTAPTSSHAQVVSIQSMRTQYGRFGLGAVVIDESGLNGGSHSSQAERVNAWYDWHLDSIRLLADEDSSIAKAFDVCSAPTTFLLDTSGRVLKRWDSVVNSGGLAQEIDALLLAPQIRARASEPSLPTPLASKSKRAN
jgi:hypothetical protein